jgi:hypothetical protein
MSQRFQFRLSTLLMLLPVIALTLLATKWVLDGNLIKPLDALMFHLFLLGWLFVFGRWLNSQNWRRPKI